MWLYSKCKDEEVKRMLVVILRSGMYPIVKDVQESGTDKLSLDIEVEESNNDSLGFIHELKSIPYVKEAGVIPPPWPQPVGAANDVTLRKILF